MCCNVIELLCSWKRGSQPAQNASTSLSLELADQKDSLPCCCANILFVRADGVRLYGVRDLEWNELVAESTTLPRESSLDSSLTLSVGGVPEGVVEFDLAGDEGVEQGGDLAGGDSAGGPKLGVEPAQVFSERRRAAM
jgi:hypothetical protein